MADGKDVTSVVRIAASVNNYHAFSTEKLKAFNSATITVTYTPEGKEAGTVTYNIVK